MSAENVHVTSNKPKFGMVPEWISEHPELSDGAVRLYSILIRLADGETNEGWWKRKTLADKMHCSVDKIDRLVKELEAASALRTEARFIEHGDQTTNLWTVEFYPPRRTDAATRPQECGYPRRKSAAPPAAEPRLQYLDQVDLDPSDLDNPPTPQAVVLFEAPTTLPVSAPQTCVDVVFAEWQRATRKQRTVLDPKRRRLIKEALRLYPVEDVVDAVWGWRQSEFHCGLNDRRTVYNELSVLLRNAESIERFRDLRRGETLVAPSKDELLMERIKADQLAGF